MHPQAVLCLLTALAGSVTSASVPVKRTEGFIIPELGDGVFTAHFGENGLVNVTRHGDVVARAATSDGSASLTARDLPVSRFGCYSPSQNRNDWVTAQYTFDRMCDQGLSIPGNGLLYAVAGVQVAFGCSWGGTNPCSRSEYDQFLSYLAPNCGSYYGGWIDMDDWDKQYGMEQRGEAICGHGGQVEW